MKTIYIDSNNICHPNNDGTRKPIETNAFDGICDASLEFYKYYPKAKGKAEFIKCIDSKASALVQKSYEDGINSQDETIAELMDEIANLCEELIGE